MHSMSDLFHKDIPHEYIDLVFSVMEKANWHDFVVLTKRSSLLRDYINDRYGGAGAPRHTWFGVSIENQAAMVRLHHLQQTAATVRGYQLRAIVGAAWSYRSRRHRLDDRRRGDRSGGARHERRMGTVAQGSGVGVGLPLLHEADDPQGADPGGFDDQGIARHDGDRSH